MGLSICSFHCGDYELYKQLCYFSSKKYICNVFFKEVKYAQLLFSAILCIRTLCCHVQQSVRGTQSTVCYHALFFALSASIFQCSDLLLVVSKSYSASDKRMNHNCPNPRRDCYRNNITPPGVKRTKVKLFFSGWKSGAD